MCLWEEKTHLFIGGGRPKSIKEKKNHSGKVGDRSSDHGGAEYGSSWGKRVIPKTTCDLWRKIHLRFCLGLRNPSSRSENENKRKWCKYVQNDAKMFDTSFAIPTFYKIPNIMQKIKKKKEEINLGSHIRCKASKLV